jgi:glutamate--cysteine ligase
MPSPTPVLTPRDVRRYVEDECLKLSGDRHVGIEVEWFTVPAADRTAQAPFDLVRDIVIRAHKPAGSRPTFEPGGQVELSSLPLASARGARDALRTDAEAVRIALADIGIELHGIGMEPVRHPARVLEAPRYRAMEAYFDRSGSAGRRMMRATAAIQVNLEAGSEQDAQLRWQRAHALGATLGAAFANSPLAGGIPNGWASGRLATWMAIDRTRTAPAVSDLPLLDAWERYVAAANVMMIRASEHDYVPLDEPFPFERWVAEGHELGYPTREDLDYHCTTLFPPVRLRGWLELRFLDALPDPWWHVAVAVTSVLVDDDEAAEMAEHACAPAADLWHQAARHGLRHPVLSLAAKECFAAAMDALGRRGSPREDLDDVAEFYDRYVARGRSPADDHLDAWRGAHDGAREPLHPEATWT